MVNVVFLEVQKAREVFGGSRFAFNLRGNTVTDLIEEIVNAYGSRVREVFPLGRPNGDNLQIIINWRHFVTPESIGDFRLKEGDTVTFAPLIDGG